MLWPCARTCSKNVASRSRHPGATIPPKTPTACSSGAPSCRCSIWEPSRPLGQRHRPRLSGCFIASLANTTGAPPGRVLPSRCLCTMTCLAALGREGPLRSHIRGALHIGFTQDQVIEVFMHMMLYGGIPFARGAMDIANDVFVNG